MASTTLCKIGQWRTSDDTLQPHPACPTGAVYDLNDGVNWSLEDSGGVGNAIDWGNPIPTVLTSSNPRTVGERIPRRTYDKNRIIRLRLILGQNTSYATFTTNLHNLVELLEGITSDQPAALLLQPAGSSTPLYADVLEAHLVAKVEELKWLQLLQDGIMVECAARPGLRGARQWLQNLAVNPGFEAPSGPGVNVFTETFTNFNAYSVQAGGALAATDKAYYPDVVKTDSPLRYYRMDETSGTVAVDASNSLQNAQYSNGATFSVTGALTGDTDTAVTIAAASSQRVIIPVTGLPTGNSAISVEGWFKFAANPAASQYLFDYGAGTVATHNNLELFIDTSGKLNAAVGSTAVITTAAGLTTGAYHYCALTWDGTTLSLYVDNAAALTATPGAQTIPTSSINCYIGAKNGGVNFFSGQMDEWAIYGAALSTARVSAHYAAATTTPPTNSASLVIPAAGRVSFGSAVWGAYNTWQTKFRFFTGLTGTWYLHYTDANNYLAVTIANGTNGFQFVHVIGGVTNTLAQATVTLVNEVGYFVQITQFPAPTSSNPFVQATVLVDNGSGAPGATVSALTATATSSATIAVSGAPQIAATGTGLTLLQHQVSLFGPGGWWWKSDNGTGTAAGAWQQSSANTYPVGPVTSFAAAVTTAAPAGTFDGYWASYNPGSTATIIATAYPIGNGVTFSASVFVTSTGLANSCAQSLRLVEFDSSGNLLHSTTLQSVSGNQASWTPLAGSVTTGASCAYVGLQLRAVDATTASANGAVTWDNCQWWNQTQTGMAAMPYCELRFPQSPAQLVISGLTGDVAAPAWIGVGTQYASLTSAATAYGYVGRCAWSQTACQLIGYQINGFSTLYPPSLDTSAYGGFVHTSAGSNIALSVIPTQTISALRGTFHLFTRWKTTQNANLTAIALQSTTGGISGVTVYPVTQSNIWAWYDAGLTPIPALTLGGVNDATQVSTTLFASWTDPSVGGTTQTANAQALLPLDAQMVQWNLALTALTLTNKWVWYGFDGTGVETGQPAAQAWRVTTTQVVTPTTLFGSGSSGATFNSLCDPYLILDPVLATGTATNQQGVNILVGLQTDSAGAVYPCYGEIQYTPLYLQPK